MFEQTNNKKGVWKSMNKLKSAGHRVMAFLLSAAMLATSVSLPQASTQLNQGIQFEYGSGAINLESTRDKIPQIVGYKGSFQYNGFQSYPIENKTKDDSIYVQYNNVASYIGADNKNHSVDMRIYLWNYQEDPNVSEADRSHSFMYINEFGKLEIGSAAKEGTFTGVGKTYHELSNNSNGGVYMEYHFYESGQEIDFRGSMGYNEIRGIGSSKDDNTVVNEGFSFVGGDVDVNLTTTTTLESVERNGLTWWQGSRQNVTSIGEDGRDVNDMKLMFSFDSTRDNPLTVIYRNNTVQSDGRKFAYETQFINNTVSLVYQIADENLPKHTTNANAATLIQNGGGETQRLLTYGTNTSSTSAQASLNKPAEKVEGYEFDGWYTSDTFEDGTKWNGTEQLTQLRTVLYGRYIPKSYKLYVTVKVVDENGNIAKDKDGNDLYHYHMAEKDFKFGDRLVGNTPTYNLNDGNTYQVTKLTVDGVEKTASTNGLNVFYSSCRTGEDVEIEFTFKQINGNGSVGVQHLIWNGSVEASVTPLEGGKYDHTYYGALGETCHVSPVDVPGWKVVKIQMPDGQVLGQTSDQNATQTYTEPTSIIKFFYEKDEESAGLHIHYIYEDETPVTTDTDIVQGAIGATTNADAIRKQKEANDLDNAFTHLEFLGVKVNNEIIPPNDARYNVYTNPTLSTSLQNVYFVYRVKNTTIQVYHLTDDTCKSITDKYGNKTETVNNKSYHVLKQEPDVYKKAGDVFVAKSSHFPGLEMIGDSGNTVYSVTEDDANKTIKIYYYYQHETHKVTTHYRDEDGNVFVHNGETYQDDVQNGIHYDQLWTAPQRPTYGYNIVPSEVKTGVMGNEDVDVTYVYSPKPVEVIVHYMTKDNTSNQKIITDKTFTQYVYGDVFDMYAMNDKVTDADKEELSRWNLVGTGVQNVVVNTVDTPIEVTFWYTKAEASVTVRHIWVDENGNEVDIYGPEVKTGKIGESWTSSRWSGADAAGYVWVQDPTKTSGKFGDDGAIGNDNYNYEVKYYYEKKQGTLNIKYRDEDGNTFGLVDDLGLKVIFNDVKTLEPKTYPRYAEALGYKVVGVKVEGSKGWSTQKEGNEVISTSGTINATTTDVTFIYAPIDVKVTTEYKDVYGNGIKGAMNQAKAKDWIQNYKANSQYTTHDRENNPAPTFYGYNLTEYPWNAYGRLTNEDIIVTYKYNFKPSYATVKYVDESGNKIAPDKEIGRYAVSGTQYRVDGLVFDEYDESPITVSGWVYKGLANNSSPKAGMLEELNEDGTTKTIITFVYKRADSAVTVRYLDTEGNVLLPAKQITGAVSSEYRESPETIKNWTLISVQSTDPTAVIDSTNTITGHYAVEHLTVKFIYTQTESKVIVNHIDEETKLSIAEPVTINGDAGNPYEAETVNLYGYEYVGLAKDSAPAIGEIAEDVTVVTFIYRRKNTSVEVSHCYIDRDGNTRLIEADKSGKALDNPVVINGKYKDPYVTEPLDIYGWRLSKVPENATGTMIDVPGPIKVVYLYEEIIPTVTTKYIDIDDNHVVAEEEVTTGSTGTRYETIVKDYDREPERYPNLYGYELVEVETSDSSAKVDESTKVVSGKYTEDDITVTYKYKKKTRSITVLFVEEVNGERVEIAPSETKADLTVGTPYDTHAKTIPGYELISVPDNAKGIVTEKPITVVYVYQKIDVLVKVRFVNQSMQDIAASQTLTLRYGDNYETKAKDISGYQLINTPSNWKGVATDKEIFVTYIYKNATTTVTTRYMNVDTGELFETATIETYPYGSNYKTIEKKFEGYTLIAIPDNASGIANNPNGIIVTYNYTAKDAYVMAKYIGINPDGTETQLLPPYIGSGKVGDAYTTQTKDINGWTLDHIDGETRGTLKEGETIVIYYYKPVATRVVAQYVDQNGQVIALEETIDGYVGDAYDTVQKDIPGYDFVSVTPNASGVMTEKTIFVVYTYQQRSATVITKYVDEQGNIIADTEYASYRRNATYHTTPKDIYGYQLTDTPANAFGNANEDVITVTYVYRLVNAKVIVKYVDDETGDDIAASEEIVGKYKDVYETEARNIDGYTLVKTPANATGTMTVETITVTYRYQKDADEPIVKPAKVIVKYVDEDAKELATDTIITGSVGKAYDTKPKTIDGYKLLDHTDNTSGVMTEEDIIVIYIYEVDEAPTPSESPKPSDKPTPSDKPEVKSSTVIVKYVDKDEKEISPSTTIEGNVGEQYEAVPKDIDGYKLIETPENVKGIISENVITVIFTYDKEEVKPNEAIITVKYVDENGKLISDTTTIKGIIGDNYEAKAKEIDGYTLKETPENAKGVIKEGIEVIFVYEKNKSEEPPKAENTKVTVKYVDKDGKEIAPSTTIKGKVGDDYEAKPIDIDGYKLKETPKNVKGEMTKDEIIVVFTYEKEEVKPNEATVLVKYVDETGKVISVTTTIKGNVGDEYEAKPIDIPGYELVKTPDNVKGTIKEGIEVIFTYKAKDAKVIVKFVDIDGKEICEQVTITGKVGDAYNAESKTVDGYKLKTKPSNQNGKMTEKDIVVTFVYEKVKEGTSTLTVSKTTADANGKASTTSSVGSKIQYKVVVSATNADAKNVVIVDKFDDVLISSSNLNSSATYYLNTSNKTIHSANCTHLNDIPSGNKAKTTRSYSSLVKLGYTAATDCNPKESVSVSASLKAPNMVIDQKNIQIKDASGKAITPKSAEIKDGVMTITLDEVKANSTVIITYYASTTDTNLSGQRIVNNVSVKADNGSEVSTKATVLLEGKTTQPSTKPSTQPSKSPSNTVIKNNNNNNNNGGNKTSNEVKTGDAYGIIFVTLSGTLLSIALAYIFLRKKKK